MQFLMLFPVCFGGVSSLTLLHLTLFRVGSLLPTDHLFLSLIPAFRSVLFPFFYGSFSLFCCFMKNPEWCHLFLSFLLQGSDVLSFLPFAYLLIFDFKTLLLKPAQTPQILPLSPSLLPCFSPFSDYCQVLVFFPAPFSSRVAS